MHFLACLRCIFIGEITSITEDTIIIIPSTIMMGSITESEVQIEMFDNYYGTDKKPEIGDYIVAVLLDDNKIDDRWVFKASSDDYKSLNLVSEKYNMVVRYEEYINEGKYFEAQKKIDEEEIELIDSKAVEEKDMELIGSKAVEEEDVLKLENSKTKSYIINNKLVLGVIAIVFIIISLFVFKSKKK